MPDRGMLDGKVAVVTGTGRGIGAATAPGPAGRLMPAFERALYPPQRSGEVFGWTPTRPWASR